LRMHEKAPLESYNVYNRDNKMENDFFNSLMAPKCHINNKNVTSLKLEENY
jgi:hypothetical protein